MKPIRFRSEAETELAAAAIWYEDRNAGLGADLIAEVDAMLEPNSGDAGAVSSVAPRPALPKGSPLALPLWPVLQNPRRCH